jgi:hypothetical protein
MKALRITLQILGYIWVGIAGVVILIGAATHPTMSFWEVMSPFNVANFVVTMLALAPGIALLIGAQKLKDRAASTSGDTRLLEAHELVNKYGTVLDSSKAAAASEALLPAPKEQIKDALVALARHTKTSGASPEALEALRVGYASLADFVSERDASAATTFDNLAQAGAAEFGEANLREIARQMADSGAGAVGVMDQSTEEFARLAAEFDERVRAGS